MIPAVQTALDTIVGRVTTLEHASGAGRIFELFVMTSIARGLRDAGFSVWLQRSDGTIINEGAVSCRGGPENPLVRSPMRTGGQWSTREDRKSCENSTMSRNAAEKLELCVARRHDQADSTSHSPVSRKLN